MAGIELSFPRTPYYAPQIHYGDDEGFWGSHPNKQYPWPVQSSEIRDFYIVVNRGTLKPPRSKDEAYRSALLYIDSIPAKYARWLDPFFVPKLYREGGGRLQRIYDEQIAFSTPLIGPIWQRPDAYGLRRMGAEVEGHDAFRQLGREVYDTWYFDAGLEHTLISCMTDSKSKNALKISCIHYFVVPELKAIAYQRYVTMEDVADWDAIESGIRREVFSYLVHAPPAAP